MPLDRVRRLVIVDFLAEELFSSWEDSIALASSAAFRCLESKVKLRCLRFRVELGFGERETGATSSSSLDQIARARAAFLKATPFCGLTVDTDFPGSSGLIELARVPVPLPGEMPFWN